MSRYIRTKDAVYEVIKNDFGVCIKIDCMFILLDDIKDKIIKEADTIEELCDEFVADIVSIETKEKYHWIYDDYFTFKGVSIKEGYIGNKFGAIWTDKGLIYVAKMNENGKLVLI